MSLSPSSSLAPGEKPNVSVIDLASARRTGGLPLGLGLSGKAAVAVPVVSGAAVVAAVGAAVAVAVGAAVVAPVGSAVGAAVSPVPCGGALADGVSLHATAASGAARNRALKRNDREVVSMVSSCLK